MVGGAMVGGAMKEFSHGRGWGTTGKYGRRLRLGSWMGLGYCTCVSVQS